MGVRVLHGPQGEAEPKRIVVMNEGETGVRVATFSEVLSLA